ncbi:hypothetical protein TorRG33x02_325270 [Trema orientale]|uniref:Uncharacterized protein n=1 Tax=Trema orientale TaxID=63057 RepID=A0A2P5BD77_TREOI|nr:hypothetical protein TorRG33x02_325270 [Trema orientale]
MWLYLFNDAGVYASSGLSTTFTIVRVQDYSRSFASSVFALVVGPKHYSIQDLGAAASFNM